MAPSATSPHGRPGVRVLGRQLGIVAGAGSKGIEPLLGAWWDVMNIWNNYCIISHIFKDIMCVYMIYTHTIYILYYIYRYNIYISYPKWLSKILICMLQCLSPRFSGKISGILRYGDWMTAWLCEFLSKNIVGACWKMQVAAKCKTNYSLVK